MTVYPFGKKYQFLTTECPEILKYEIEQFVKKNSVIEY